MSVCAGKVMECEEEEVLWMLLHLNKSRFKEPRGSICSPGLQFNKQTRLVTDAALLPVWKNTDSFPQTLHQQLCWMLVTMTSIGRSQVCLLERAYRKKPPLSKKPLRAFMLVCLTHSRVRFLLWKTLEQTEHATRPWITTIQTLHYITTKRSWNRRDSVCSTK